MKRPSRWFAVGSAEGSDAGRDAAEQALVHDDARLLIVFCAPSQDLAHVLRQVRTRAGDVPLIGCTTAGEIAATGPGDGGVVVTAFGGEGFAIATAVATDASKDLRAAGAQVARCLGESDDHPYRVLLLLTDGLAGDQQEIVRGAYGVLGAGVPLVGGCAGDGLRLSQTFQMHGDQVLTDAVVAAGIASDAPLGIGVRHGWRPVGEPMLVTRSGASRVHTLDDRPALVVYLEHLDVAADGVSAVELARLGVTRPLGVSWHHGEEMVRFIAGGDFAERSLLCNGEVPQGGLVRLMEGDADSVLAATDAACSASLDALGDHPPLGMLAFDCIARRGVLGAEGIQVEIERLAATAGGAPIAGFYTYGEIARTGGMRGFHNHTLVVLAVG
jgi:hypothetical protein